MGVWQPRRAAVDLRYDNIAGPSCSDSVWSSRRVLTQGRRSESGLHDPTVALQGPDAYVFGTRLSAQGQVRSDVGPVGYRVHDGRISPIPLPPGARSFARPNASIGRSGKLGIVWSEETGADTTPRAAEDIRQAALWFAEWSGDRWTKPLRLLSDVKVDPANVAEAAMLSLEDGRHLIVPGFSPRSGPVVVHLIFSATQVREAEVLPLRGIPLEYLTAAAIDSNGILVAYSARGAVHAIRSLSDGSRWSEPVTLDSVDARVPLHLRSASGPSGVQVIWGLGEPSNPIATGLAHASFDKRTGVWTSATVLDVPGGLADLELAVDRCGIAHVLFESIGGPTGVSVTYLRQRGPRWDTSNAIGIENPATDAILGTDGARILAVWTELQPDQRAIHDSSFVRTLFASLRR